MTVNYVFLAVATVLLAGVFAGNKVYQSKEGTSLKAGLRFNIVVSVFSCLFYGICHLFLEGFSFDFSWFSLLLASLVTLFVLLYTLLSFSILQSGNMALYTLFLMSGGTLLPYLFGLIFLGEDFSVLRTVGLTIIIVAIAVSNLSSKNRISGKHLLLCIAVFFLNGFVSIVSKIHQVAPDKWGIATSPSTVFTMLNALSRIVLAGIAYIIVCLSQRKTTVIIKNEPLQNKKRILIVLAIIFAVALFDSISYLLQVVSMAKLPATVQFPFLTGGSIVISTLVGVLAFKEKPSVTTIISVILCFGALFMFL